MRVARITRIGKADVYNMEVADTHDFVIQGGVVVHNCADETRYFCMYRPIAPKRPPDPYANKFDPALFALDIKPGDLRR